MHVLTFQGTAKMDKPIEMPFRGQTCVDPRNHVLDGVVCTGCANWQIRWTDLCGSSDVGCCFQYVTTRLHGTYGAVLVAEADVLYLNDGRRDLTTVHEVERQILSNTHTHSDDTFITSHNLSQTRRTTTTPV